MSAHRTEAKELAVRLDVDHQLLCPQHLVRELPTADGCRIALLGEIDISNADEVRDQIVAAQRSGPRVVVDLADLTFLGVAGMRALAATAEWCRAHDRTFALADIPCSAQRAMTMADFRCLTE